MSALGPQPGTLDDALLRISHLEKVLVQHSGQLTETDRILDMLARLNSRVVTLENLPTFTMEEIKDKLQPTDVGEQKTGSGTTPTCENTVNVGVTPEGTLRREDSGGWDDP